MSAGSNVRRTFRFAGLPLSSWLFALRNWAAMMLALYVAFWLQLDGASTAGTCVAILSLQTRGQAMHKAMYRMAGTVVGVAASITIAGVFSQAREPFLLTCCVWLGGCAVLASVLDGNRAYGAILSGYTVAIVALPNVDTPLNTFSSGVNRGAAITIGILAIGLVNDVLYAPNLFPRVHDELRRALGKVTSFAMVALRDGDLAPAVAASLMRDLTGMHPNLTSLSAEGPRGRVRFEAARLATVRILRMISAIQVAAAFLSAIGGTGDKLRQELIQALESGQCRSVRQQAMEVVTAGDAAPHALIAASASLDLLEHYDGALEALAAMRHGRGVAKTARSRPYKSRAMAARNGLRVFLAMAIATLSLSFLGWPGSVTALVQFGSLAGLSTLNPYPQTFALQSIAGMTMAAAAAGATEFLILDGVDQFQLLALAMSLTVVGCSLLLANGGPKFQTISFLGLVYFPVILTPENPQSYNPQSYLFTSFLSVLATVALLVLLSVLLPTSDEMRRKWILRSAKADLRAEIFETVARSDQSAWEFRESDRIGQLADLHVVRDRDLRYLVRVAEMAACARRTRATLGQDRTLKAYAQRTRAALAASDPERLRTLGREMLVEGRVVPNPRSARRRTAIDLFLAATLIERSPRIVAELREDHER